MMKNAMSKRDDAGIKKRATNKRLLAAAAMAVGIAPSISLATDFYWDTNGAAAGLGSATSPANWSGSFWNTDSTGGNGGSVTTWTNSASSNAFLAGTAGTLTIDSGESSGVTIGNLTVNTTGYKITSSVTAQKLVASSLVLGANVGMTLDLNSNGPAWTLGNIALGTGSVLTISGIATASNADKIIINTGATISGGNITLAATGAGPAGFVSSTATVTINTVITNNSLTSITSLGASSTGNLTMGAKVTGSAGLQFGGTASNPTGGAGTITLNAANDYTGNTTFNAAVSGVIKIGIDDALPTATNVTMAASSSNGGIFDLNGHNQTIGSLSSGVGGGSITDSAAAAGSSLDTLTISGNATPGAFGLVIGDGANRKIALVRSGNGSTTLSGQNTYTGGTTIFGGTLTLGNATNTLADAGNVSVAGGVLDLGTNTDTVGAITLSGGNISGSGTSSQGVLTGNAYNFTGSGNVTAKLAGASAAVTKTNAGVATLFSANTYGGSTTISGGTLALGSGGSIGNSTTITVGSGATFDVHAVSGGYALAGAQVLKGGGTVSGAVTVASGTTLSPGSEVGTLNIGDGTNTGNTTLSGGGSYNWQLFDANGTTGTGYDTLNITGALTLASTSSSKFNVDLWTVGNTTTGGNGTAINFNNTGNYTWVLATASNGISGFSAGNFTLNTAATNGTSGFANGLGGGTFSLSVVGNNLDLLFTPGATNLFWSAGTWATTSPGTGGNGTWTDGSGSWDPSKTANFAGTAGTVAVTAATANKGIIFSTTGYTVSGGTITLSGNASNDVITTDTNVIATISSALSTSGGISKAGLGTLIFNTAQSYTGGTSVSAGTLQLGDGTSSNGSVAGNITNAGIVAFANPNDQSYAGVISGGGSLTKSGAGTLTLTNTNSYLGGTTISAGTLVLGQGTDTLADAGAVTVNGGTLGLGTNSDTVGAVTLTSGNITGSGTLTGSAFLINNSAGNSTISANLAGGNGLTKSNPGNVFLTGANSYTGGTALNGGTTTVSVDANLGDAAGNLTFGGGTLAMTGNLSTAHALTVGSGGGTIAHDVNNFSTSAVSTISGVLATTGTGDVALNGNVTFNTGGALNVGTGGTVTLAQAGGTITMPSGGVFNGDLIVNTTARLNLDGNTSTYGGTGSIKILGTALGAGSGSSAISSTGNFTNFNALITNLSATPAGTITSNIVLNPAGAGHVAFTPGDVTTATYTTASFLAFVGGTSSLAGPGLVINGKITGEGDLFFGNNSETGGGAGNITLNAENDYAGNTLINSAGSTIKLGIADALPDTNVVFGSLKGVGNSTLDLNGVNQHIASLSDGGNASSKIFLTITNNGSSNATLFIDGNATPATGFGGNITDGNHTLALTLAGNNTLFLTGTSAFTGGTTISSGTLKLGSGKILSSTGAVAIAGGSFDLNGSGETVGAVTMTTGSLVNNTGNASKSLTGSSLTKNGPGTATIGALADFTGSASVTAGALLLNGSITGNTSVSGGTLRAVNSAALSGNNTTLSVAGGTIAVGPDTTHAGALNFNQTGQATTWGGNGTYAWKTTSASGTAGIDSDLINMGNLTVASSGAAPFTIALSDLSTPGGTVGTDPGITDGAQFVIAHDNAGFPAAVSELTPLTAHPGSDLFVLDTSNFTANGGPTNNSNFTLEFVPGTGGDDLVLTYNVTPEPGTAMLLLAGGVPMLLTRRRRKATAAKG